MDIARAWQAWLLLMAWSLLRVRAHSIHGAGQGDEKRHM